jgi:hypothetical protein
VQRVADEEGALSEFPFCPGLDLLAQALGQLRDGGFREAVPAELLGDLLHASGRHALPSGLLHQRQNEGFLRALVPLEELRGEGPVSVAWDFQFEPSSGARGQLALVPTVAVSASPARALLGSRAEMVGHLLRP